MMPIAMAITLPTIANRVNLRALAVSLPAYTCAAPMIPPKAIINTALKKAFSTPPNTGTDIAIPIPAPSTNRAREVIWGLSFLVFMVGVFGADSVCANGCAMGFWD
jgi:hypothetical protein